MRGKYPQNGGSAADPQSADLRHRQRYRFAVDPQSFGSVCGSTEFRISSSVRIYLRRSAAIFVSAAMNTYFLRAIYKQLEKTTKGGSVT